MKRSQTTFLHRMLLMLVFCFFLISCGKDKGLDNGPDNQPDTSIPPAPLKISKIDIIPGRAYIGLRILLRAQLADSSGSIDYHWRIYLGGKELSQKYDGKGLSTIACSLSEFGEHTVKLTASRDSKEIAEHEIKLSATVPSEQFGTWGDSKQTIMDTELSWHKGLYTGPVSPPNVPGETGLNHVSFDRLGSIVTYYFRDDKLKAVSEMRIKTPPVAINDVMALYTTVYSKQAVRQTKFEIKTNDEFVGTEQERWDAYLSSDALYEAIRKGKLIYHRSGVSSVNGTIYWNLGYRNSQTLILEEIVLPPK